MFLRPSVAGDPTRDVTMKSLLYAFLAVVIVATPLTAQGKKMHAAGTFDVTLVPQTDADSAVGRMTIDKVFHGDIEGTSKGMMLASMSPSQPTSGAYVALEKVTGTVHGKKGSFALHHVGLMDRGAQSLTVMGVPDSGTDDLVGITGTLKIIIDGKKHSYEFDYTLPK